MNARLCSGALQREVTLWVLATHSLLRLLLLVYLSISFLLFSGRIKVAIYKALIKLKASCYLWASQKDLKKLLKGLKKKISRKLYGPIGRRMNAGEDSPGPLTCVNYMSVSDCSTTCGRQPGSEMAEQKVLRVRQSPLCVRTHLSVSLRTISQGEWEVAAELENRASRTAGWWLLYEYTWWELTVPACSNKGRDEPKVNEIE